MAIIADTGALIALIDDDDRHHSVVADLVSSTREAIFVPSPVVPEVCYLLSENLGADVELEFVRSLATQEFIVEHFTVDDLKRAVEILEKYQDAEFGMVDATVMAMAERMKIKTILTIDRRDLSLFRPRHCDAFTLVPDLQPARK
jgi:hypothetical protein